MSCVPVVGVAMCNVRPGTRLCLTEEMTGFKIEVNARLNGIDSKLDALLNR